MKISTRHSFRFFLRSAAICFMMLCSQASIASIFEIENQLNIASGQWHKQDRQIFEQIIDNQDNPSFVRNWITVNGGANSFIVAARSHLRRGHSEPFSSINLRRLAYSIAAWDLAGQTDERRSIRFFFAAAAVTAPDAVGALESDSLPGRFPAGLELVAAAARRLADSGLSSTLVNSRNLLRLVNHELFKANILIIRDALTLWTEPRDPRTGLASMSGRNFDVAMVEFEQKLVQDVLNNYNIPAFERANTLLALDMAAFARSRAPLWIVSIANPLSLATRWAEEAGCGPPTFGSLNSRLAIGKALVFLLSSRDYSADGQIIVSEDVAKAQYTDHMRGNGLCTTNQATIVDRRAWAAAQSAVMQDDTSGMVSALYGIAASHTVRSGPEAHAGIADDFAGLIARARQVSSRAEYNALIQSGSRYSLANSMPPYRPSAGLSTAPSNRRTNQIESLYQSAIEETAWQSGTVVSAALLDERVANVVSRISATIHGLPERPQDLSWSTIVENASFQLYPNLQMVAQDIVSGSVMHAAIERTASLMVTTGGALASSALQQAQQAQTLAGSISIAAEEFTGQANFSVSDILESGKNTRATVASIRHIVALFGDENLSREIGNATRAIESFAQIQQAATMMVGASTGVGGFLAATSMLNALGGLGGPDATAPSSELMATLNDMFKYMREQFTIVNQKLDFMIDQLVSVQNQLSQIQGTLDEISSKITIALNGIELIRNSLSDVREDLERLLFWNSWSLCSGHIVSSATNPPSNDRIVECIDLYIRMISQGLERSSGWSSADDLRQRSSSIPEALDFRNALRLLPALTSFVPASFGGMANAQDVQPGNTLLVWHGVTGLAVFQRTFSDRIDTLTMRLDELKASRDALQRLDDWMTRWLGSNFITRRGRLLDLLGSVRPSVDGTVLESASTFSNAYGHALRDVSLELGRMRDRSIHNSLLRNQTVGASATRAFAFPSFEGAADCPGGPWREDDPTIGDGLVEGNPSGATVFWNHTTRVGLRFSLPDLFRRRGLQLSGAGDRPFDFAGMLPPIRIRLTGSQDFGRGSINSGVSRFGLDSTWSVEFFGPSLSQDQPIPITSFNFRIEPNLGVSVLSESDLPLGCGIVRDVLVRRNIVLANRWMHLFDLQARVVQAAQQANDVFQRREELEANGQLRAADRAWMSAIYLQAARWLREDRPCDLRPSGCTPALQSGSPRQVLPWVWAMAYNLDVSTQPETRVLGDETPRGRFLRAYADEVVNSGAFRVEAGERYERDPGHPLALALTRLDSAAAAVRTFAALSFPTHVSTIDPLRMLLAGTDGVRIVDGQSIEAALRCIRTVRDANWTCDSGVVRLIEDGLFANPSRALAMRLNDLRSLIERIPDHSPGDNRIDFNTSLISRLNRLIDNADK